MSATIIPFPVRAVTYGKDYYTYDRRAGDVVDFARTDAIHVREFMGEGEREDFLREFAKVKEEYST
jgi:hypothetical protein